MAQRDQLQCGLWVVDLRTGAVAAHLVFHRAEERFEESARNSLRQSLHPNRIDHRPGATIPGRSRLGPTRPFLLLPFNRFDRHPSPDPPRSPGAMIRPGHGIVAAACAASVLLVASRLTPRQRMAGGSLPVPRGRSPELGGGLPDVVLEVLRERTLIAKPVFRGNLRQAEIALSQGMAGREDPRPDEELLGPEAERGLELPLELPYRDRRTLGEVLDPDGFAIIFSYMFN